MPELGRLDSDPHAVRELPGLRDPVDLGVILGRQRDWIEVRVPFTTQLFYDADLGLVGTITFDRYGLDAGKKMMVVAIRYELGGFPTATLTLWG